MSRTDPIDIKEWQDLEYHDLCLAFPEIPEDEFEQLHDSILGLGLMESITVFQGKIIDGRHRHLACKQLAEKDLDVQPHFDTFMGPGSPVDFVMSKNFHRRNMTPPQRLHVRSAMLDWMKEATSERQKAGADATNIKLKRGQHDTDALGKFTQSVQPNVVPFRSPKPELEPLHVKEELGKLAGVSAKTAQDFLTVKSKGTEEDYNEMLSGKKSISKKANEVRKQLAPAQPPKTEEYITLDSWDKTGKKERLEALAVKGKKKLNKQDNDAIGWAKWSWNPITGCLHNCPYCYARDIANRFYEQKFKPSIIPLRLTAPQNQVPRQTGGPAERNIFTGSMTDMFGKWVPEEWIEAVMQSVERSPEWNFLFLTKFPKRMIDRKVSENVWLGASVDTQSRVKTVEDAFERVPAHTKWLSLEPLLEPLQFSRPELFNWVVIGGASVSTKTPEWAPPFEWVIDLYEQFTNAGVKVYFKHNVLRREFPWQEPIAEMPPKEFKYRGNQ